MGEPNPNHEGQDANVMATISRAVTQPLVSPLEKLIGEGRIRDNDRPHMFIAIILVLLAPFIVLSSPENTNLRIFLVIIFALLIPVTWGSLITKWLNRGNQTREKNVFKLIIFVYRGSKAKGIADAEVRISGAKPFKDSTDGLGQVVFEYPSYLRDQNQIVYIQAEHPELGSSDTFEIQLTGQNDPLYIELNSTSENKAATALQVGQHTVSGSIFISYSSLDRGFAERLTQQLSRDGFDVWIDKDRLKGGARFTIALENAIRQSACVLALISRESIESRWVRNEIAFALDHNKYVIPIMLEKEIKMPIEIYTTHFVDAFTDWIAGYSELVKILKLPSTGKSEIPLASRFDPLEGQNTKSDLDPFLYGSVIPEDLFVGRSKELQDVTNRIGNRSMQSISIVGTRRIGKTSLLNYIAKNYTYFLPSEYKWAIIYLDMMDASTHSIKDVMGILREGISRQIGKEPWNPNDDGKIAILSTSLKRLVNEENIRFVFCLDELESILGLREMDDFVETLRSLGQLSVIGMITSTAYSLKDLVETSNLKSPFYNIFRTVHLGLMPHDEWSEVIKRGLGDVDTSELELVRQLAGGHPHLTQLAGSVLWRSRREGWSEDEIRSFFYEEASEQVFTALWQRLSDEDHAAIYSILGVENTSIPSRTTVEHLQKLGIVSADGNDVFCQPFAEFIREETL